MNITIKLTGLTDMDGLPITLVKELPPQNNPAALQALVVLSKGDKVVLEPANPGTIFGPFTEIRGEVSEIEKSAILYIPTVTIRSITIRVTILQVIGHPPSKILDTEHGLSKLLEDGWKLA